MKTMMRIRARGVACNVGLKLQGLVWWVNGDDDDDDA